MKFSEGALIFSIILGGVAVWVADAKLQLNELAGWVPWVVGLVIAGTAYGALIEGRAHENQADKD